MGGNYKQKLMRLIVNNLMPNLASPLVPLFGAPNLLEVHLPQFGNIGTTYNVLFSGEGEKNLQKIQGPNFRLLHTSPKTTQTKNGDSCCLLLKRKVSQLFYSMFLEMSLLIS